MLFLQTRPRAGIEKLKYKTFKDMEYNFKEIEAKWQSRWRADKTYKVEADPARPKF